MKYLFFVLFFTMMFQCFSQYPTYKRGDIEYYVYPLRQNLTQTNDVIPYLGPLPDGNYVVFEEIKYKKKYKTKDTTKVSVLLTLVNGKKQGIVSWLDNDQVIQRGHYENDLKEGNWKASWSGPHYRTKSLENYKEGLLNGLQLYYHENGKLKAELSYSSGMLHGKYKSYTEEGRSISDGYYIHGKEDGEWRLYSDVGNLQQIRYYNKGKAVGTWLEYRSTGKVCVKIEMDSSLTIGVPNLRDVIRYELKSLFYLSGYLRGLPFKTSGKLTVYYYNDREATAYFLNGHISNVDTVFNYNGEPRETLTVTEFTDSTAIYNVKRVDYKGRIESDNHFIDLTSVPSKRIYYDYSWKKKDLRRFGKYQKTTTLEGKYYNQILNRDTVVDYQLVEFENGKTYTWKRHLFTNRDLKERTYYYNNGEIKSIEKDLFSMQDSVFTEYKSDFDKTGQLNVQTTKTYYPSFYKYNIGWNLDSSSTKTLIDGKALDGMVKYLTKKGASNIKYSNKKGVHHVTTKDEPYYEIGYSWFGRFSMAEGVYEKGNKEGKWKFTNDDIIVSTNYSNNKLNGELKLTVRKRGISTMYSAWYNDDYFNYIDYGGLFEDQIVEGDFQKIKTKEYIGIINNFKEGMLDGVQKTYYPNGKLYKYENYKNGNPEGKWFHLSWYGDTILSQGYMNGELNGIEKIITKKNSYTITPFKNGLKEGITTTFKNGKLTEKGEFKEGQSVGTWKTYSEEGDYWIEKTVLELSGDTIYPRLIYHQGVNNSIRSNFSSLKFYTKYVSSNGVTLAEGKTVYSQQVGLWKFYNEKGILVKELDIQRDTVFHGDEQSYISYSKGSIKTWFDNGQPYFEGSFADLMFRYDCNRFMNIPEYEVEYRNIWNEEGHELLKEGTGGVISYHDNGLKKSEGEMENYSRNGMWKFWDEDGKLERVGVYEMGLKEGRWLTGDLEGINFVDECLNPNLENGQMPLPPENGIDKTKVIRIMISNYKKDVLINTQMFQSDKNAPVKPNKY